MKHYDVGSNVRKRDGIDAAIDAGKTLLRWAWVAICWVGAVILLVIAALVMYEIMKAFNWSMAGKYQ